MTGNEKPKEYRRMAVEFGKGTEVKDSSESMPQSPARIIRAIHAIIVARIGGAQELTNRTNDPVAYFEMIEDYGFIVADAANAASRMYTYVLEALEPGATITVTLSEPGLPEVSFPPTPPSPLAQPGPQQGEQ